MAAQSRNIIPTEQVAENNVSLPVRIYNCPHCDRSFSCSQAVAGHCKSHYSRNETLKPQRQRNRQPDQHAIPAPAVQLQEHQTASPLLPNRGGQLFYNHNPQYHLYQQQIYAPPQLPAYYIPYTDSVRVNANPIRGMMNNFDRVSTSNQVRGRFGEQNVENEELDLTLHL